MKRLQRRVGHKHRDSLDKVDMLKIGLAEPSLSDRKLTELLADLKDESNDAQVCTKWRSEIHNAAPKP